MEASDKYDPNVIAVKLKAAFEHPKNNWRGPITVNWYQGGLRPASPISYLDVTTMPNGAIFEGTKGIIVADFNSRVILPNNNDGDLTYYNRRSKEQLLPLAGGTGETSLPVAHPPIRRAAAGAERPAVQALIPVTIRRPAPTSRLSCSVPGASRRKCSLSTHR